jgi:hypothetical protein
VRPILLGFLDLHGKIVHLKAIHNYYKSEYTSANTCHNGGGKNHVAKDCPQQQRVAMEIM